MDRGPAVVLGAPFCPDSVHRKPAERKTLPILDYAQMLLQYIEDGDFKFYSEFGVSEEQSKILLCEKDLSRPKVDAEQAHIYKISYETSFPLLNTFEKLVHIQNPPVQVVNLIKLICKMFWSTIYNDCPKKLLDVNVLDEWIGLFLIVLEGQPGDAGLRTLEQWLKVKKWILKILNHLFTRSAINTSSHHQALAKMFINNYGGKVLECCLDLLSLHANGERFPDKLLIHSLQYLTNSVLKINMYNLLKPRLDVVLFDIIFTLICFNNKDQKLWDETPTVYLKKSTLPSPRTTGINFLAVLLKKKKDTFSLVFNFLVGKFKSYERDSKEIGVHRRMDGALLTFGTLSGRIIRNFKSHECIEYLKLYVLPELNSPVGHLRARAIWVAGEFACSIVSYPDVFHLVVKCVTQGLRDSEYAVRCSSVIALRSLVEACDRVRLRHFSLQVDDLAADLKQLSEDVFEVMNAAVNTDLVRTIEAFVETFSVECVAPHASLLCQNLVDAFWKYDEANYNEVVGQVVSAKNSCLRSISRTMEGISEEHSRFVDLEPILLPIVTGVLTNKVQARHEEVFEMLTYMIAFPQSVSKDMWSVWPLIAAEPNLEFFTYISDILQNYILKDTQHFLTSREPDYQRSLWNLISTIMDDKEWKDIDIEPATKLMEAFFQNCRGQVDTWLEPYLRITVERLQRTEQPTLKCLLLLVIGDALYYDASSTLKILKNLVDVTSEIINLWLQMLQETQKNGRRANFRKDREKKVCCLGLTSLLSLPVDQLPGGDTLEHIYKANLDLLVAYEDQVQENGGEFEDGVKVALQLRNADESGKKPKVIEPDFDFVRPNRFDSPIDLVDPFILFDDTLKEMDALKLENLRLKLDTDTRLLADSLAEYADRRRLYYSKSTLLH